MRYEKGRKEASRQKILEVAAERFRSEGIAATGLATIMSDAGMTNGAFYPHFPSKADLVRETVALTTDPESQRIRQCLADGDVDAAIDMFLSAEHRDSPGQGCPLTALLPEIARQPVDTRRVYAGNFQRLLTELAAALPPHMKDRETVAIGIYAIFVGAVQLARAAEGTQLSDRILTAGRETARALARGDSGHGASANKVHRHG